MQSKLADYQFFVQSTLWWDLPLIFEAVHRQYLVASRFVLAHLVLVFVFCIWEGSWDDDGGDPLKLCTVSGASAKCSLNFPSQRQPGLDQNEGNSAKLARALQCAHIKLVII